MLDARQSFKAGFLAGCAEEGLLPSESGPLVKAAEGWLDTAASLGGAGLLAAFAAPVVGGAGAGYAAAKLTDVDDTGVDDVKRQELIDEYRRQAGHVANTNEARRAAAARKPQGRVLF